MSKKIKIIFLDIDGVLNFINMPDPIKTDARGELSKGCIVQLNKLTSETGAKIVITSTWRKLSNNSDRPPVATLLRNAGVTGEIIGETPILRESYSLRGNEIYAWMQENEDICGGTQFKDYVILDDDSDMLYWQRNHFVNTDGWAGLTPTAKYKAKRILMYRD